MESVKTLDSTTEVVAALSEAKRELLEGRLRGKLAATAPAGIPPRPVGQNPMSFGQERLWIQSRLADNPSLFNIAFLAHIDGALDTGLLEASINDVISRHEILRAGFLDMDGVPEQTFAPLASVRIEQVDLTATAEKALTLMRAHAQVEARRSFDLSRPPLMRVTQFELAPSRNALCFVVHHIVWDGWSSGVFIDEITALYQAMRAGQPARPAPLTAQYADFAHWHRVLLASEVGARQIDYWRERLAGAPELISLPTDRPRRARQRHEGAAHEWKISGTTLDRVAALARRLNVTQFSVLLAAYNVLLMHYSGEHDIAIGAAMACRTHPSLEKLLGFFANVLPLRTSLEGDPNFERFIQQTHQTSVDAQSNQDAPFDMLVERLAPRRTLGHNPLFQVAFVQHHLPIEELQIGDLRVNFENLNAGAAVFDLVLHIYGEAPGLKAVLEYDSHLFDARTIRAMAACFDTLLDRLLDAPTARVSQASLLNAQDQSRLLSSSAAQTASDKDEMLLHDMLHVASPDAIAVVCGWQRLTYRELAVRSDQLAHHLRAKNVLPDAPVAMLIEPAVDMIVTIFGILKADGAYLPLDPSYPPARIRDILKDSGAQTLVTTSALAGTFGDAGVDIVLLDSLPEVPTAAAPKRRARTENLAYLIYTSGSTGFSKGVMIPHCAAVASTRARAQFYAERISAFLLLSSVSFDSSVAGIFWTLAQGATLYIATDEQRRDPGALARIIAASRVSHLLCLPSLHDTLLDVAEDDGLSSLRCCIVAGEICGSELADKHFRALPDVELVNEYGPTECSVWSAAHRIPKAAFDRPIPVGRPIPGAQTLVLDACGALLPQGAPGELSIGGLGLARGYANRPDLTADRFRPNPYGAPGDRLYRSGDRARCNADGDMEFLGRLDVQLKIRGYRVDPREIESVMIQHQLVSECVVVVKALARGAPGLVAYCRTTDMACVESALREHASARLPSFMAPDCFVMVDALPRLPNGKIDRNTLPEPSDTGAVSMEDSGEASVIEILVADVWRDVLGVSRVVSADNFFDLGGNSLAAMQVIARIRRIFGHELPVNTIFENPDLRTFARSVRAAFGHDFEQEIAALLSQFECESVD